MKRYYLELNGVFVKDSNSLKIITRHYENYRKKYKDGLIGVYDKQTGEYILSPNPVAFGLPQYTRL